MRRKHEVLTVEEVAELLRLKPFTVRELAKKGKIPAWKVGRQWRFSREVLLEYLRGDRQKGK